MNLMNTARTFALLSILTGVLLAIGYFAGGQSGALVALIFSALINFFSYWYSDKIVLKMYHAQKVSEKDNPALHKIVAKLSKDAGIPKPPVYIINSINPNAFATGRNPKHAAVAVTTGIMELLDIQEIEAVLAHELGHVANRDTLISTMAATLAGAVTWVAQMAFFSSNRERNAAASLFMLIVAPLAASLVRLAISRGREFGADEYGAKLSQKPLKLASALQKIDSSVRGRPWNGNPATAHMFIINPLSGSDVAGLFSTHPSTEARVERLKRIESRR
ncbi:MAG: zinc metalloprotease HtpX [Candidatus Aenigmarchaeota archaeon]|nr:zinc metalloprotease HtpX [Candidatus Aenigmarchaeota archaeon]